MLTRFYTLRCYGFIDVFLFMCTALYVSMPLVACFIIFLSQLVQTFVQICSIEYGWVWTFRENNPVTPISCPFCVFPLFCLSVRILFYLACSTWQKFGKRQQTNQFSPQCTFLSGSILFLWNKNREIKKIEMHFRAVPCLRFWILYTRKKVPQRFLRKNIMRFSLVFFIVRKFVHFYQQD